MAIDRYPSETYKNNYIKEHGENGWIKHTGHYLEFRDGSTLKYVVDALIELRSIGFNSYYTTFNGCDLFVRDITLEDAFLKLHNLDRQELISYLDKQKKTLLEICQDNKHILRRKK